MIESLPGYEGMISRYAEIIREATGAPLTPPEQFILEHYVKPVVEGLPDDARGRAQGDGSSMTVEQAVDYALTSSSAAH